MKPALAILLFWVFSVHVIAQKQVDRVKFFADTAQINATLTINIGKVLSKKDVEGYVFPAIFSCKMGDSLTVNDPISVEVRGHFRRQFSYLPPLKLHFNADTTATLQSLKSLKLVNASKSTNVYDQYLLKEYIIYKIYNLITDKSFNVRLLNLNFADSSGKKKTINQHAFLVEDIKQTAKRSNCKEWTTTKLAQEATDRRQMTIVAIFEYMIGNTDWSVPADHNIKLIEAKNDPTTRPYVIPYDFDFSGLVATDYSVPDENLNITSVQQRLYRGFPRTMDELNEVLDIFKSKKDSIYATINNFNLLTTSSKRQMTDYLDGFYDILKRPQDIKDAFITNARME